MNKQNIYEKLLKFIKLYTQMEMEGIVVNCPYWSNKIENGKVKIRGFMDGKGSASAIRQELIDRLHKSFQADINSSESIRKFAKRERIGIDCSGLVYRCLDKLINLGYANCQLTNLAKVFTGSITKTNADMLTSNSYCVLIDNLSNIRLGDLIRMSAGRHIAIVISIDSYKIIYAHSSSLNTRLKGVHLGKILIKDRHKPIEQQDWLEETGTGENFQKVFYDKNKGDGVFRLKIFE